MLQTIYWCGFSGKKVLLLDEGIVNVQLLDFLSEKQEQEEREGGAGQAGDAASSSAADTSDKKLTGWQGRLCLTGIETGYESQAQASDT